MALYVLWRSFSQEYEQLAKSTKKLTKSYFKEHDVYISWFFCWCLAECMFPYDDTTTHIILRRYDYKRPWWLLGFMLFVAHVEKFFIDKWIKSNFDYMVETRNAPKNKSVPLQEHVHYIDARTYYDRNDLISKKQND